MATITLNKSNFFYNLDQIKEKTGSLEKIAIVLKDNAYGHGLREMATLAHEYGVSRAVVRTNKEAELIEEFFPYILILADFPQMFHAKRYYTINDLSAIPKFEKYTQVELKVNTGMNRNGIEIAQLEEAFELIKRHSLTLSAVFTHHSCADELHPLYEEQKNKFELVKEKAKSLAKKYAIAPLRFHSANSATLFREASCSEDMVRVGIAAYGCLELPMQFELPPLRAVLSLHAQKISSRVLQKGSFVGYGASFCSKENTIISNYDFGYADGFLRECSNIYKTPQNIEIAGRISMDNSSFLTDKESILIFEDAREVSKFANTISYEVLTSLKSSLKREFI